MLEKDTFDDLNAKIMQYNDALLELDGELRLRALGKVGKLNPEWNDNELMELRNYYVDKIQQCQCFLNEEELEIDA